MLLPHKTLDTHICIHTMRYMQHVCMVYGVRYTKWASTVVLTTQDVIIVSGGSRNWSIWKLRLAPFSIGYNCTSSGFCVWGREGFTHTSMSGHYLSLHMRSIFCVLFIIFGFYIHSLFLSIQVLGKLSTINICTSFPNELTV